MNILIKPSKLCKREPKALTLSTEWNKHNCKTNFCYVKDIRILWILDWSIKKFSIKKSFPKTWENLYPILNEREGGGGRASHTRTHGGYFLCNKNFQFLELMMQMKIVITLHVYLFLTQLIKNCSSLKCIPEKKLKSSKKIALCVESKGGFLVELKHNNSKSSFTLSIAKDEHGDSSETYENPSWLLIRNVA